MAVEPLKHFLLVYDVRARRLLEDPREYRRPAEATAAYEAAERQHLGDESVQIVLVASESLDTVRVTHSNFFDSATIDDLLEKLIASFAGTGD